MNKTTYLLFGFLNGGIGVWLYSIIPGYYWVHFIICAMMTIIMLVLANFSLKEDVKDKVRKKLGI